MSSSNIAQFLIACEKQDQAQIELLIADVAKETPKALEQGADLVDDSLRVLFPGMDKRAEKDKHMQDIARRLVQKQVLLEEQVKQRLNGGWRYVTMVSNLPLRAELAIAKGQKERLENITTLYDALPKTSHSPLYWMAATHQLEKIKDLTEIPSDDPLPLNIAALCGHTEVVKALWQRGAQQSNLLVALACRGNHSDGVLEFLLANNAPTHLALHQACEKGNLKHVQALLEKNADVTEVRASDGKTPLHIACAKGNRAIVDAILTKFPADQINARDLQNRTALELASMAGKSDVVKLLLQQNGIELGQALRYGITNNDEKTLEALLDFCVEKQVQGLDWADLLNEACRHSTVGTVSLLLEKMPEAFTTDMKNNTLDLMVSRQGEGLRYFVTLLLKHGAGNERRMLRTWMQKCTNQEAIQLLREKCRTLTGNRPNADSPHWSQEELKGNNLAVKQAIFDNGILADAEGRTTGLFTPFYWAAYMGLIHELEGEFPLDNSPNRDEELSAALGVACTNGNADVVKFIAERAENVVRGNPTNPHLWIACRAGHVNVVKELLTHGSGVEGTTENITALTVACKNGHVDVVRELLSHRANVNCVDPESGFTPLMIACDQGNETLLEVILDHNPDLTFKSNRMDYEKHSRLEARLDDQFSAMHLACQKGHDNIVKRLMQTPLAQAQTALGYTPLEVAIAYGKDQVVALFQGSPERPDAPAQPIELDYAGPAFVAACCRQDLATAKHLLARCETLNTTFGEVINEASINGQSEVVEWILSLNHKLDLNPILITACRYNRLDIVEALLKAGADVNTVHTRLITSPLLIACHNNHLPLLTLLAGKKPNFAVVDQHEQSPVQIAMSNLGGDEMIRVLFDNPNYTNKERSELLILACQQLDGKGFYQDEKSQILKRVKIATALLMAKGVNPEAKAEAQRLAAQCPSILDIIEPSIAAKRSQESSRNVGMQMEAVYFDPITGRAPLIPPQSVSQPSDTPSATRATNGGAQGSVKPQKTGTTPSHMPITTRATNGGAQGSIEPQKAGATPSVKFLAYIENIAKKFENSKFPRGKQKYDQLVSMYQELSNLLRQEPNLSPQQLLTRPIEQTDGSELTLEQALEFRRYLTKSKTARQVKQETTPSELKILVDEFFTTLARRLKSDKTGKYAALQPFLANRPDFNSVEELCRYSCNGKNLLQVLMKHRNSTKEGKGIETKAYKAFAKKFHIDDHLTQDEIRSILTIRTSPKLTN